MPSILDPLTCGFAKVRCYCIFTCNNSTKCVERDTLLARRYAEFCNTFNDVETFHIDLRFFRNFRCIVKNLQKLGKSNKTGKLDAIQFFSLQNWKALTTEEKKQHSLFNCQGYTEDLLYKSKLALFKNVANPFKGKAFKAGFHQASDAVATAQDIVEKLDKSFKSVYKQTFSSVVSTAWNLTPPTPEPIPDDERKQKQRNKIGKEFKKELEGLLAKNVVER